MDLAELQKRARHKVRVFEDVVEGEQWKRDHDASNTAFIEMKDALARGVYAFEFILALDATWRQLVLDGTVEFDRRLMDAVRFLYEWWLKPCEQVEREISEWEQCGHEFDLADRFREHYRRVQWIIASPADALGSEEMAALRDAAVDAHEAGQSLDAPDAT